MVWLAKWIKEFYPDGRVLVITDRVELDEQTEEAIMQAEEGISTAGADFTKLQELTAKLEQLNADYEQLIERWSYLDGIVNG